MINLYNTKFLWNRAVRSWVIAIPRLKIWGLTSLTPCRIFIVVPLSQSHNAPTYQLAISIFDLMILMCHMLRSVRSKIIFTVWTRSTYPFLNYNVFYCCYVVSRCNLWPLDLECLSTGHCQVIKVCTKFEQNRTVYICGWVHDDLASLCQCRLFVDFCVFFQYRPTLTQMCVDRTKPNLRMIQDVRPVRPLF